MWENLVAIVSKGDNLPIAALLPVVAFFTWVSLRQAARNDRLIRAGRPDEVLDEMRK